MKDVERLGLRDCEISVHDGAGSQPRRSRAVPCLMALLDRALIAALVVSVALVSPSTADACTCGSFFEPTAAACATAKRVFAGSVTSYRWPTTLDYVLRSGDVEVELLVDRVWKGNVPAELVTTTGLGGGDCGISPLPGTRFLYCSHSLVGGVTSRVRWSAWRPS